jgi:tetratricopeptide (TPR) repeat protein
VHSYHPKGARVHETGATPIATYRRAIDVDPVNFLTNERLGFAFVKAGRYDEAIAHLEELARLEPDKFMGHYTLAHAYAHKGRYRDAMAQLQHGQRQLDVIAQPANFDYSWVIAVSADRKDAEALIQVMLEYQRHHYLDPMFLAEGYAGLGEKDKALDWLEKGYQQHSRFMIYLIALRELDNLHSEPRFQDLVRRMNFPR